jgi:hypothetical protein
MSVLHALIRALGIVQPQDEHDHFSSEIHPCVVLGELTTCFKSFWTQCSAASSPRLAVEQHVYPDQSQDLGNSHSICILNHQANHDSLIRPPKNHAKVAAKHFVVL